VVSAIIFLSGYCSGQIWILISPWGGQEGSDAYYRVNGFDAEVFSPQDILASALDCHEGPDSEKAKKNSSQVPAVFAGPLQRAVKAVKASFGQGSDFFGR
jgi:hypothetical protein